jgi:putative ABC transport system permease protein
MNFFLNTFVLLKPGASAVSAAQKCNSVFRAESAAQFREMREKYGSDEQARFGLQPLAQMHLSADYPAGNGLKNASNPVYSYILTGIAAFMLVIACINFVNLTVTRSLKRAKEIGIRKVPGASVALIARQLSIGFLKLVLSASAIAIPLAWWAVNKWLDNYSYRIKLNARMFGMAVAGVLLIALLTISYQAIRAAMGNPVKNLRTG